MFTPIGAIKLPGGGTMRGKQVKVIRRYSEALKHKVVEEVESCRLTVREAQEYYDIPFGRTISRWVRQYGKEVLPTRMVRVIMNDEAHRMVELEKLTAKLQVENAMMRAQYEIALEEHGEYIKKKLSTKQLKEFEARHKALVLLWNRSASALT
jgi:transposase-like protein